MTPEAERGCAAEGTAESVSVQITGWHATFWIMLGLAFLFLAVRSRLSMDQRIGGGAVLALLGAAYGTLIQRRVRQTGWRATVYLCLAVVATGVANWIDPNLSLLLFTVYPQVWMFTESLVVGTAFAAAVTVSTMLGFLVRWGFTWATLRDSGPQMTVALLFSVLLGVWISRVVGQSVERAALIAELEAARTELSQAEHSRGVMAERERMAREIHDTLAQGFTSIVMLAQAATAGLAKDPSRAVERLGTIEDVARENLAEARALVAAFAPVALQDSTLPDAVRRLTERFTAQTRIPIDLEVADSVTTLSRDQEVVLLRAVQEALTNVRRHSGARQVVVRLLVEQGGARAEVGDDGVGFAIGDTLDGFGLAGMRGRVRDVGGTMDVASVPGEGTRVVVQVPVQPGTPGTAGEVAEA
jgi:signal transduction histidine kinase